MSVAQIIDSSTGKIDPNFLPAGGGTLQEVLTAGNDAGGLNIANAGTITGTGLVGTSLNVGAGPLTCGAATCGAIVGASLNVGGGAITSGPITAASVATGAGNITGGALTVTGAISGNNLSTITGIDIGGGITYTGNANPFLTLTGSPVAHAVLGAYSGQVLVVQALIGGVPTTVHIPLYNP
jgi:hypothetical protein